MIRTLLAWAALAAATIPAAHASVTTSRTLAGPASVAATFRAPGVAAVKAVHLAAPDAQAIEAKRATAQPARERVATVRPIPKARPVHQWTATGLGHVVRFTAVSDGALGLRVRLDTTGVAAPLEVRVQGSGGRIESMMLDPARREAWTPWTAGDTQLVEVFSPVLPQDTGVAVGAVLHFDASPFAKAAGTCTVPTACSTNDPALDAAIAQRRNSVMRIQFVDGGSGFVCSATLVNTERFPEPFVLTANHCIDNADSASTVISWFFYELTGCDTLAATVNPGNVQVPGGMQLVFANYNVDATLLRMRQAPPAGATYAGLNPARLSSGAPIVSISHPTGDTSRLALGTVSQEYRVMDRPQDMYGVRFSRGIIQGGSSGSGLFALAGGSLQLRAILSASTVRNGGGMSCTNLDEEALYSRFDIFHPQMAQYIRATPQPADDAPNRPQDLPTPGTALAPGATVALDNRRLDYAGDVDVYRFELAAPAYVSAWTEGANIDTVGTLLDSRGVGLEANDDAQSSDNHFGITRRLAAGTYFVQVTHWEPAGTGAYNLRVRADAVGENYTDLWWNPAESGWGLSLTHQGNILFGVLYTYDAGGNPLWLVMSKGDLQPDGAYAGTLFRGTGAPFNAAWRPGNLDPVGTMRVAFTGPNAGTLTYTFGGTQVTKQISRNVYAPPPACTFNAFDRSYAENFQDLWGVDSEPGWGVSVAHQGNTLFAALFTYDAAGRDLWLVMSNGAGGGNSFSGPLYRMRGPAFDASPWPGATPTPVGTMRFNFANGNSGTLTYTVDGVQVTKAIRRHVFSTPKTQCES